MKVILLKDVPKLGRKFTAVEVADGYAANFLFPKSLAEPATATKLVELKMRQEKNRAAEDARIEEVREKLKTLSENDITMTVKTDDTGHLFKKLRGEDIAAQIQEEQGIELEKESILLEEPISEVGEYDVRINAAGESGTVKVLVAGE